MSKADFDIIEWSKDTATDAYNRLYKLDRKKNFSNGISIGVTYGLTHINGKPMLMPDTDKYITQRLQNMVPGQVEAIAIWRPHAFKKHTLTVTTLIDGETLPETGQLEVIEKALLEKANLGENEKATNIRIISETPKYTASVIPFGGSKTLYHIIGNGISANDVLNGLTTGYETRTEAKAELKKIMSRSRSTKFNLPLTEEFEIIGFNRVATAKAKLSKLAVRAKMEVFIVDENRPHDGWIFYGYPAI